MVSKTDYYELLGVNQDSTSDEIKSAFRKQALIWHPDKNSERIDEATEKFKLIHEAYSVLSDPHEKAWYDSHKSEILTGQKSEEMDLWTFFSPSAYPGGFTDEPDGFFSVYDELFEALNKKENSEVKEKSKVQARPRFGNSTSNIENLKSFYNYWSSFTTDRIFAWADAYNPAEAPNRKVRRIIEVENTKERNKHRKAYNEMVASLVDYLKKRDPRWVKYIEESRLEKIKRDETEAEQKKIEESKQKELKEIYRKQQAERYAREYEEKMRKQEEEVEIKDKDESEDDEELIWCDICRKSFLNQGQLNNHKNSKKHKQTVQKIMKEVQLPEEVPQKPKKNVQEGNKNKKKEKVQEEVKKNFKPQNPKDSESSNNEDEDEDHHAFKLLKTKKKVHDEDDLIEVPPQKPENPQKNAKKTLENPKNTEKPEEKKIGKAKLKREKKKAQETTFICRVCKVDFHSKNKLFTHLKDSDHERGG